MTTLQTFVRASRQPPRSSQSMRQGNDNFIRFDHGEVRKVEVTRPRVLCIDDDPEIGRTLEIRFRNYEVDVRVAYFGTHGFFEAITESPDLIMTDVGMPSGDGHFVLESLRNNQKTYDVPVVVLTGMRDETLKRDMLNKGANAFLSKPVRFDHLIETVSDFIDLRPMED